MKRKRRTALEAMSDRYNALTVVLEGDIYSDDAEALIGAISQLRGVLKVVPRVSKAGDFIAEERARRELRQKLWGVLYPKQG